MQGGGGLRDYVEEKDHERWCRRGRQRYGVEKEKLCDNLGQGKVGRIEGRRRSLLTTLS